MKCLKKGTLAVVLGTLVLSGCSSMKDSNKLTGETEFNETTKWATIGATGGAAIGGLGGVPGAAVGAAIGAFSGGYYGSGLDLVKEEIEESFEQYGVDVKDVDGVIFITVQDTLLFEKSEYKLDKKNTEILDKLVEIMSKTDDDYFLKVSGHTDTTGKRDYNISLSESRAKEVAFYLFDKGMKAQSIDYKGYAGMMPIASNDTIEGRQENRRVEIQIIPNVVKY